MRTNYNMMPSDYVYELQRSGKREKARAFMEYFMDVQADEVNSISFYCKSWGKSSKGSVHKWIQEFRDEIEKFFNFWSLKNQRHYTSVKNKSERQVNGKRTKETVGSTEKTPFQKTEWTQSERQVNQVFNICDDDIGARKEFDDIYFIYRMNTKYAGKKEDAYAAYMQIKDRIDTNLLKLAVMIYLHDDSVQRKFNLANFLKNEVYLTYLPQKMRICLDGVWIDGTYNRSEKLFETTEWKRTLMPDRLVELYKSGDLEYIQDYSKAS